MTDKSDVAPIRKGSKAAGTPAGPPTFDPWGVVNLVMFELSRQGIKTRYQGHELGDAKRAAEDLLTAFGITPLVPPD